MRLKSPWEHVCGTRSADAVSWFQRHAEQSLRLIHQTGLLRTASIIDVGGGASTLVDDLLNHAPSGKVQRFIYCYCRKVAE